MTRLSIAELYWYMDGGRHGLGGVLAMAMVMVMIYVHMHYEYMSSFEMHLQHFYFGEVICIITGTRITWR